MRKGSCSRPGRRSPTRCRSSAGDTCGPSWPQYEAYYNGRRPIAAASSTRPGLTTLRRPLPGADQAPTRPRRPYQRIRAGRIEATVKTGGRVLDPTGRYFSGRGPWFGPGCAGLVRPGVGGRADEPIRPERLPLVTASNRSLGIPQYSPRAGMTPDESTAAPVRHAAPEDEQGPARQAGVAGHQPETVRS